MSPRNLHRLMLATAAPAVLLLFLSACNDPTQPSPRPQARAAAVVINERTQWIDIAPTFCNGEAIPITGTIHEVISLTETGTGVLKHVIHFRLFAKGTSPTTAEMVIVNHVGVIVFPDAADLSEGTGEIIAKLIGQSSGVIELFRVKYHLTYDAAGRVTAHFDEFEIVCPSRLYARKEIGPGTELHDPGIPLRARSQCDSDLHSCNRRAHNVYT